MQDYLKALDSSQEKVIATCLANQCVGGEKYNVLMGLIVSMNKTILKQGETIEKLKLDCQFESQKNEGLLCVLHKRNTFFL